MYRLVSPVEDKFIYVEMASRAKKKVGGKVMDYNLNLRYLVGKANLYVMIIGSFDIIIGMDWLKSHEVILKCKKKWLSLVNDEEKRRVIV
jgi:hypothetical protein